MKDQPGFYDGVTDDPVRVQLQQLAQKDFRMLRAIGYVDPHHEERFLVPADLATFETDLTSVPAVFLWLVPSVGTHLPAALLHDGLVCDPAKEPRTYVGPEIDREEADRIFRDAMKVLGTPRLRRWLVWAAVSLATAWEALRPRAWWRGLVIGTLGLIALLGIVATLDVFDVWDVLPWMGDRPWWYELIAGATFAVVIPALLSLLWGRLRMAALIAGVNLALLLHVTIAVAAVLGVYFAIEKLVSLPEGRGPSIRKNLGITEE
jgi:hypothetical protein